VFPSLGLLPAGDNVQTMPAACTIIRSVWHLCAVAVRQNFCSCFRFCSDSAPAFLQHAEVCFLQQPNKFFAPYVHETVHSFAQVLCLFWQKEQYHSQGGRGDVWYRKTHCRVSGISL